MLSLEIIKIVSPSESVHQFQSKLSRIFLIQNFIDHGEAMRAIFIHRESVLFIDIVKTWID